MDMTPDVSVIIVSWNVAPLLKRCLRSVVSSDPDLSLQVIVVDNASSDESDSMLRGEFPWVQLISNRANLGFARACNQGLRLAMAPLVLLLNPDTIVAP